MTSNLVLSANFVTNNFVGAAGTYYGLFSDPLGIAHQSAGWFKIKTDSKLKFSGKILVQGEPVAVSGTFDQAGVGTLKKPVYRKGYLNGETNLLTLNLDLVGGETMTGVLTNSSGWSAELLGDKLVFSNTYPSTAFMGTYGLGKFTMVHPGSLTAATEPGGDGYGLITMTNGIAKPTGGRAGDYHLLKSTVTGISKNGAWPFYAPMYAFSEARTNPVVVAKTFRGSMQGWLFFTNNHVEGELFWNKISWTNGYYNDGFTNSQTIIGSTYLKPNPGTNVLTLVPLGVTNGTATLSDGNLPISPTNNAWYLSANNKYFMTNNSAPINPLGIKLTQTYGKGEINGFLTNPVTPSVRSALKAVVMQEQTEVRGVFLGTTNTGSIRLLP
jgi:hypothetical protein